MENDKPKLARKNMYMSHVVAEWYEDEAERLGVSQSALMTMVLSQYIDQKRSMDMGETLKELMDLLKEGKEEEK